MSYLTNNPAGFLVCAKTNTCGDEAPLRLVDDGQRVLPQQEIKTGDSGNALEIYTDDAAFAQHLADQLRGVGLSVTVRRQ